MSAMMGDEWQHTQAGYAAHHQVERALDDTVGGVRQRLDMVGVQTLSHKLQRIEVQLVALKLAWQIVEVNHVLVAVLHQPDYLLRLVVRQTAEHLVHIGRCSVNRVVD